MVWEAVIVSIVLQALAYVLTPRPKTDKPQSAQEMDAPVADAGRPIPVVFGTVTIKSPNVVWYGDKRLRRYKVKA